MHAYNQYIQVNTRTIIFSFIINNTEHFDGSWKTNHQTFIATGLHLFEL